MKKILVIIATFIFVLGSIFIVKSTQNIKASTEPTTSGYAKVITNDCYLYKQPDKTTGIFLLEQSYFVKVIDDVDTLFFKVNYLEFEGFVEKSKICFVEEYPNSPYLVGITFDVYDLGNVCMRSTPVTLNNDKNILCTINVSKKDLTYYGKCVGEEAITGLGNVWYYCGYEDEYGNIFKGYIYSPLTRNLSAITNSQENFTFVNVSNFLPVDNLLYLNLSTKNMLIVITAIPTIVIAILFVLPDKILSKKKHD